ncbi:malate dehydrogenase (oxaloacetate-decarboxylating) [Geodermatophilus siccatus]|uniref:Putative malate oxidoreductase [NAD] n=1 Tax=Geodermatophilus siccatus TaxID=1137991 RepID=A0A1G9VQL9_9ACTN|nr:NAD-dependent malic enzyme [Geodermatophilus siccatus]SDM74251.1 malate dehydrogenase (oxaloacetate-decarboxylating) [Geodermatophilus siccatus]
MYERPYELVGAADSLTARVRARGNDVLRNPMLNRGTAFTEAEREALGLEGLLPSAVSSMDGQVRRTEQQYRGQPDPLAKHVYLASLRDRNEVLFYRLLSEHLEEMLPIVYTPTIGDVIERFSHDYNRPRGVFLSIDEPDAIEGALRAYGLGPDDCDLIVATDSEGILGIGDQGVGGIQISIGKLTVYTAAGGIHPRRVIPVVLDVGTDNLRLLDDPMYLGNRHPRVRGQRYDDFIDAFVTAATALFPNALLHWEDFGASNARRILERYDPTRCTFNDDMQGTAAVVLAAVFAAMRATGERLRDQRVVVYGAGTAGIGIADMLRDAMVREGLSREEATQRFWALGSRGLLTEERAAELRDFQVPYARPAGETAGWAGANGSIGLAEVVTRARPTILIGTSTQPGAFSEPIVRTMAASTERPVILPLSNPTSLCEALPEDLVAWTDGRALVATGSPFPPVHHDGTEHVIAQANNALVFPGLGLGVSVVRARRVSTGMLTAAAAAVAELSDAGTPGSALLPPVDDLRSVSAAVGIAVAQAAAAEGLAQVELHDPVRQVHAAMWRPEYPRIEAV